MDEVRHCYGIRAQRYINLFGTTTQVHRDDELRRAMAPAGTLVVGFFDGEQVEPFEHKVVTAWLWPVDELSARLRRAGFTEVERRRRSAEAGNRPHAAIAATAD